MQFNGTLILLYFIEMLPRTVSGARNLSNADVFFYKIKKDINGFRKSTEVT